MSASITRLYWLSVHCVNRKQLLYCTQFPLTQSLLLPSTMCFQPWPHHCPRRVTDFIRIVRMPHKGKWETLAQAPLCSSCRCSWTWNLGFLNAKCKEIFQHRKKKSIPEGVKLQHQQEAHPALTVPCAHCSSGRISSSPSFPGRRENTLLINWIYMGFFWLHLKTRFPAESINLNKIIGSIFHLLRKKLKTYYLIEFLNFNIYCQLQSI